MKYTAKTKARVTPNRASTREPFILSRSGVDDQEWTKRAEVPRSNTTVHKCTVDFFYFIIINLTGNTYHIHTYVVQHSMDSYRSQFLLRSFGNRRMDVGE